MLVPLSDGVRGGAVHLGGFLLLVLGDHLLAAAGVARQGEAGQQRIRGENPRSRQRVDDADKAAGVAAGVGNALGVEDLLPVGVGQLRKAVGPVRIDPVGGGGVNDHGVGVFH